MVLPQNYQLKILAIICLVLLALAALIAWAKPATGYEIDIYASTPILTWIFLTLAMLGGTGIIIQQVVTQGFETSRTWVLGLLILVLGRFGFLYVPYIRGYVTWQGDNITHWGYITDVLETGHFFDENYYPVTHSLLSQVTLVTGSPLQFSTDLSTAVLVALFIMFTYLLACTVLPKRSQQLVATAATAAIALGYNVFLTPNGWSILMLPLVFYMYFQRQTKPGYALPFAILLVMFPFFHPLSALVIVTSFLSIIIFKYIAEPFLKKNDGARSEVDLIPVILELVILLPWLLSFSYFKADLRQMWMQITSGGPDVLGAMVDTLAKINMHGLDIAILFVKLYGVTAILIVLSLSGLVLTWIQLKKGNVESKLCLTLNIGATVLMSGFLYLLYLTGVPGMQSIGAQRLISYTSLFMPVLASVALIWISQTVKFKPAQFVIIFVLLIIPASISLRGLFYSPFVIEPNAQITHKDIQGMEWFISKKDSNTGSVCVFTPPYRLADGILGKLESSRRADLNNTPLIHDHFGYNLFNTLGEQYKDNEYTAIPRLDRIVYTTVWRVVGRFNENDFARLEEDKTVDKLYSNGEMDIYFIHAAALSP